MTDLPSPRVCTAIVVERRGRVLLLRRGPACSWPGTWCFPGGRLEPGETLAACCARELREEAGLQADRFVLAGLTEVLDHGPHLVGLVHRALGVSGQPRNCEPDRHDAVGWFDWGRLPAPLMPGVRQFVDAVVADNFLTIAVGRPA